MGAEVSKIPSEFEGEETTATFAVFDQETDDQLLPEPQEEANLKLKKRSKSMSDLMKRGWRKTERALSSFGETLKIMCEISPFRDPSSNY